MDDAILQANKAKPKERVYEMKLKTIPCPKYCFKHVIDVLNPVKYKYFQKSAASILKLAAHALVFFLLNWFQFGGLF